MSKEAMKLALEWIEDATVVLSHTSSAIQGGLGAEAEGLGGCSVKVATALREALAEQTAQQEPVTEFKSPGQRWADGDDHDSRSEALYKFIADTDFKHCRDSFCFKSGGDGDNGETLMFILDCWFAQQHTSPQPAQRTWVGLTDEEREQHRNDWHSNIHDKEFRAIEAKLKERNQ